VIPRWFTRLDPPPDVFAIVMASGIVSVAALDHEYFTISVALFAVAFVAFVVLGVGFVIRALTAAQHVIRFTRDPDVAVRMFTFVAACTMLDARWKASGLIGYTLGGLAVVGWLVLVPLAVADIASRPATQLRDSAHGVWLLPSVATSGLATLSADLAASTHDSSLTTVAALGCVLALWIYLAVTGLIMWRIFAPRFQLDQLAPDSWILTGALAICALAAGHIHAAVRALGGPAFLLTASRSLIIGTLVLASLWIPPLLYAEMWRADHLVGALRYHRAWWSAVFPIGMYSAASFTASRELRVPALTTVSLVFFWIALVLWTMVATGLVHTAMARARARA
jgi:tellurite resistance protein TehA-like permease